MRRNRSGKIVATLGPASSSRERIADLAEAGVDVFRFNFSHDYKKVYIADTGSSHYADRGAKPIIWEFPVEGEKLGKGKTFASMEMDGKAGNADGVRVDEDGNVWAAMGWVGDGYDGVHVFSPDGTRIGQIRLPEICGNLTFGGSKKNRLFMAASQSLYAVYVETKGAHIT